MRDRFIETLTAIAQRDPRVMLITGDLGFGVLDGFRRDCPTQFMNVGVAEQNLALVATGMALEGRVVFTYSIGNFPTLRCLEMLRNDAAYHGAEVKVVAVGGGLSYGPLGFSHHATEDLSILRSLPGVTTFAPTGPMEVSKATEACMSVRGTCYLRLDKDAGADGASGAPFVIGQPREVRRGSHLLMLATGGILSEVLRAADLLAASGVTPSVFSVHTLRPMDTAAVAAIVRTHHAVLTVEEHTLFGGLGGAVLEALADHSAFPRHFTRLGLDDYMQAPVGSQTYLRRRYGLDAETIAARAMALAATVV